MRGSAPLLLWRYRRFILRCAWNDVRYRHAEAALGVFWTVVSPLLQAGVYTVVFARGLSLVQPGRSAEYALYVCAGLFPWTSFSENLVRSSQALLRQAPYLRSIPLPHEACVAASAVASLLGLLPSLTVLTLVALLAGTPPDALWVVPAAACLLHAFAFALALPLAELRVLFGDVSEFLRFGMLLWMWSLPIVYPDRLVAGSPIFVWAEVNPPYLFVRALRGALLEGQLPHGSEWVQMLLWPVAAALVGSAVARRLRPGARDQLVSRA
jgi:ABC-type polysaccharide/polyol phosphate export permease